MNKSTKKYLDQVDHLLSQAARMLEILVRSNDVSEQSIYDLENVRGEIQERRVRKA